MPWQMANDDPFSQLVIGVINSDHPVAVEAVDPVPQNASSLNERNPAKSKLL